MNSIRIRVVKTQSQDEKNFHVQFSMDNLLWWTLDSCVDFESALQQAKDLETQFKNNWKVPAPTHILWKTKV